LEVSLLELAVPGISLYDEVMRLAPFGQGNRPPRFLLRDVFLEDKRRIGTPPNHFSCTVTDGAAQVRGVRFNPPDLEQLMGWTSSCDVIFELDRNDFRGRSTLQLLCRDIFLHDGSDTVDDDTRALLDELEAKSTTCLDQGDYHGILDAEAFPTKLAGVTFEGRQEVLASVPAGATLQLRREPHNPYDPNAIAVDFQGRQMGFLNARLAARLAPALDAGASYDVQLTQITGGKDGTSLGANVWLAKKGAGAIAQERMHELEALRARWQGMEPRALRAALLESFIGPHRMHDAQERALDSLAAGRNTLCVMATGRGKSLIFQLHAALCALQQGAASIFVYPLRALVADQAFHLQESFSKLGLRVELLTGETPQSKRQEIMDDLTAGRVDCILTTPEFLSIHAQRFAATGRIAFLAVDEAHHVGMSKAGHRPAYAGLDHTRHELGDPLTLAVTATAGDEVASSIRQILDIETLVTDPSIRSNLILDDKRDVRDRDVQLAHIVASGQKTVVYVNSREHSVRLARMLRLRIPQLASRIAYYNAGLPREDRNKVEQAFRDGRFSCIISTSAFGEGVNIPDIRHVVLY
ncbi:MAG: DEAD/DEAH box helicase, partial [Coriobacteriales bacterium]|nr:DEAD/DEAH box helicase [Coriobacteriales bacterium]